MPVRIKVPAKPKTAAGPTPTLVRIRRALAIIISVVVLVSAGLLVFFYTKYSRLADVKMARGLFPESSMLYSAPQVLGVGDVTTPQQIASRLRESGYGQDVRANAIGWFHLRPEAIEIFPGPNAYTHGQPGVLRFNGGKIASIIDLTDNSERTEFTLEPALLSSLYDKNREKRRLVKYQDLPPVLVHALISAEDKRFFQHSGFDPIRIVKAALVDMRERRQAEGASTLTQQLARMLWLDNRKTFSRKFAELMITIHIERKLTKEQILEYYANQVDLGRRGSFAIRGFGEASQAYFGKDVRQLTLPEAATLAGLIQEPSYRNPVRWPERARTRRNVVLRMMLDNGYISKSQYEDAADSHVVVAHPGADSADAPYFVDLVNEQLADDFEDKDFQASGSKIYTTLDPELQHDATVAVASGMKNIETILAKRHKKNDAPFQEPQIALICLDPHTGEVKALIGGRNYSSSQLNHAISKRPSGSVFKPFVYAAALNTGLDQPNPITVSSTFSDEPQTFMFEGKPYEPADFHKGDWKGDVTVREALADSLNVPAVEVAQAAGLGAVADLAHKAGLDSIRATPAEALGAYDVTPMQMAGAYTVFANGGERVEPRLVSKIVNKSGDTAWSSEIETKKVLDPRVNFLMVSLLQDVLRFGTGARVWSYGLKIQAAGKTGTSHDAWFAGFSSKLLCIVWVGLDDYQDLKTVLGPVESQGSHAALPFWAEFMTLAHQHRAYRDATGFPVPQGVVSAQVDRDTGALATSACPKVTTGYYILGTQPVQFCQLHQGGSTEIASWGDTNGAANPPNIPMQPTAMPPAYGTAPGVPPYPGSSANLDPNAPKQPPAKQKRGLFDKFKSIFK